MLCPSRLATPGRRYPSGAAHFRDDRKRGPLFEAEWKSSAEVYLLHGAVPAPRALFARPALADTWDRLCREAVGPTREARIDAARHAL